MNTECSKDSEMQKDTGSRLAEIVDELRAIGANGLHWSEHEYDNAR